MPNINNPTGFVPLRAGARVSTYKAVPNNAAIGVGDPIVMTSTGEVDKGSATDVYIGISADSLDANTGGTIRVYDDPDEEFVVQTTGGDFLQTHIGNLANASITPRNETTKLSTCSIDMSTVGTSSTLGFLLKGKAGDVSGSDFGAFCKVIVKINRHLWNKPASGV